MRIDWMLLAEGLTQDSRGAWAVIGLGQNILGTRELPANTKRAVLSRISGLSEGETVEFSMEVVSPGGAIVAVQHGVITVGERPFPEIPETALDVPGEFFFSVQDYGEHKLRVSARSFNKNDRTTASVSLYVVDESGRIPEG